MQEKSSKASKLSPNLESAAIILVIGVGILAIADLMVRLAAVFVMSGAMGVVIALPIGFAAGLFARVAVSCVNRDKGTPYGEEETAPNAG